MNERIKDLIEQSTTTSTSYSYSRGNVTETYCDKEKFAELLLQECLKVMNQNLFNIPLDREDFVAAIMNTANYMLQSKLKQHFGIKE